MENYNYFVPQGWQCPICKRVYSPSTSFCLFCGAETTVTTTSSTDIKIDQLKHESVTTGTPLNINGGLTISTYPLEGAEE